MEAKHATEPSAEQIDPRGDMLKTDDSGDVVDPGVPIPPYEGRTTGTHEQSEEESG
ncbi:MAG: hypothetical protein ACRDX8_01980 [Acidimicrobiales bacterium]